MRKLLGKNDHYDIDYTGKTILITGAGGFLGSHLTPSVATTARVVHCVARTDQVSAQNNVNFHTIDLCDSDKTKQFFDRIKPDVVFHLASASGGSTGVENVLPHLDDDIITTVNCLLAAQSTGVSRFIIPGSSEERLLSPESVPDSPYSIAKMACVRYGRMFYELYGTPIVICRIFMAYGPGQKPRKIIPYVVRSMLINQRARLVSGARLLDWIFVDDAIDAMMLASIMPGIEGKTLEIGSGELVSVSDIAAKIHRLIPDSPIPHIDIDSPFAETRAANLDAAYRYLGWSPIVSLDEGLEKTVEWYKTTTAP